MLAPLLPLDLLFLDIGGFRHDPGRELVLAGRLLRPGGLLVMDAAASQGAGPDSVRDRLTADDGFLATELLTTPRTAVLVAARIEPRL